MSFSWIWTTLQVVVVGLAISVAGSAFLFDAPQNDARANDAPATPQATPVSVALVEERDVTAWEEFSGRLEAIERVVVRPRVAGAIQAVHFREGALVKAGDPLVTIDPAPFAAEVDRNEAQVAAAEARVAYTATELDRGRKLIGSRTITERDLDARDNAHREAEASLRAAKAALQSARLNLGYTDVRAPVAGRVGKLEITVGNLVSAGPEAPAITTLVSVDPIYASFDVAEGIVARALASLPADADPRAAIDRIPVEMTDTSGNRIRGRLQLVDNEVRPESGTVRVRAVFDNPRGTLMPGQFARLRMGQPASEKAVVISERAVGADQDKSFVMVVGEDNKAVYREVTLGVRAEGLRVVTNGLKAGERIVVNGLHRVRPGALIAPQIVSMEPKPAVSAQSGEAGGDVAQR